MDLPVAGAVVLAGGSSFFCSFFGSSFGSSFFCAAQLYELISLIAWTAHTPSNAVHCQHRIAHTSDRVCLGYSTHRG